MANYQSKIANKFKSKGYKVKVTYTHRPGEHPAYYIKVWKIDGYVWNIINEILDECGLFQNDHYTENGIDVFNLFDPEID